MSPIIKLPIYFGNPKLQIAKMYEFLGSLNVGDAEIEVLVPRNIYLVTIDFKYRKQWKLFCEKFWGEGYFNEFIKERKDS